MTGGTVPNLAHDDRALDDFWEASSLDRFRLSAFSARLLAYEEQPPTLHPFTPSGAPVALRPPRDRLQRLFNTRRSRRTFSDRPLRHRHVERLLAATGPTPDGRRVIPEAGGLAAVHVHAVVSRARGPLAGQVVRYDHRAHAATVLRPVPDAETLRELFQLDDPSTPQLMLAFAVDPGTVVAKYGARAGRFLLQQVGHAAQNVGLRLAADGLRGYVVGGGLDHDVLRLLGLAHTGARYVGAIACGR
jgi:Nitroreductase family